MTRPSDVASYEDDFFAWTQEQGRRPTRFARGSRGDAIAFPNLVEEIEDLGKRELREVKSHLSRLLEHLIKIADGPAVPHWRSEALVVQRDAVNAFSPGMRRHICVDDFWRHGIRVAEAALDQTLRLPTGCPLALSELLATEFDLDRALAALDPID